MDTKIIKVTAAVEPIAIPAMAPLLSLAAEEVWVETVLLTEEWDVEAEAAVIEADVLLVTSVTVVTVCVERDVRNVVVFLEEEVVATNTK